MRSSLLHLYFEAYPPRHVLDQQTGLAVRYQVRPLPPESWSFWGQFSGDYRRQMNAAQRPVVQATFTFLPGNEIERQQLSIDISALDAGLYALTIEVVDPGTGEETGRTIAFEYVREERAEDS